MGKLAGKDIFTSYRPVLQPFRHMLLARSKSYGVFLDGVREKRSDASAGGALRLKLARGTPVLAPANMRLIEASEGGPYGPCAVFSGRRYIFTFYRLVLKDGMLSKPVKAGSVIGTVEAAPPGSEPPRLHLMVTKKRFLDGASGQAVDAMALIEKAKIRPPFMPEGVH